MEAGGGAMRAAELRREGQSRFEIYDINDPNRPRSGPLDMSPERFDSLLQAVEPYRAQALDPSTLSTDEILNSTSCRPREVMATDYDGMSIEWKIGRTSFIKHVYFGCDPDRNAARYDQLRRLFESLNMPEARVRGAIGQ